MLCCVGGEWRYMFVLVWMSVWVSGCTFVVREDRTKKVKNDEREKNVSTTVTESVGGSTWKTKEAATPTALPGAGCAQAPATNRRTCPCGSMEEHLTTDQRVAGSNPVTDDFFVPQQTTRIPPSPFSFAFAPSSSLFVLCTLTSLHHGLLLLPSHLQNKTESWK
jgi:hypothetical protein